MTFSSIKAIWPRTMHLMLNLMFVYALEYSCIGCLADRMAEWKKEASTVEERETFMVAQFYIILNMSYQIGVFFSRSSLSCFKIKRVTILTILQLINFILLLVNTSTRTVLNLYALCPMFVWVGFMGGGAYVNIMHNMLELDTLKKEEKEVAVSFSLILVDAGCMMASIF